MLKAEPAAAGPPLRTAVTEARETGQNALLTEALSMASIAENMAGDHAAAERLIDEAEDAMTGLDYPPGTVAVLQARSFHGFFESDLAAVTAAATEGARLAGEAGDLYVLMVMVMNLGSAALTAGDLDGSWPLLVESLRLGLEIDDRVVQFYLLAAFGCHAALSGRARLAAQLFGAADTAGREAGANIMPFLVPLLARARETALAALGAARFEAGFQAGQRLDRTAALRLVPGERASGAKGAGTARRAAASAGVADDAQPGPLAKREADIARLVAEGLTNKQIGTRLFISERTVDSHVRSILNKLGVNSRAQIAAWMASAGQ